MNYSLTCLTPTLIGNGDELAPIDYMVWKDQVNVLDQRRIFKLFARGPRLDGYLQQLKKATKLDFASWGGLAQNYAGRRIPFESGSLTRHFEHALPEHLFIRTFSANATGVYVPGTAIKGALRTGTVFAGWNDKAWESVNALLASERVPRRIATQADERLAGRKFDGLGASDSTPIPNTNTRVYLTSTSTLAGRDNQLSLAWKRSPAGSTKSPDDATPTFIEMANPGSKFEGVFRSKGNTQPLFQAANQFALGLLTSQANYAETAKLGKLSEAIATLKTQAERALESSKTCLLPLGWGGGFLGKAALADASPENVREVLRKLPFYQRAIQSGLPFPKTRRIVFLNDQPATLAGWTLLEIQ